MQRLSIRTLFQLVCCWLLVGFTCSTSRPSRAFAEASVRDAEPLKQGSHGDHIVLGMKGVSTVEHVITNGREATLSGYGFASVAERSVLQGRLGLELDFVFTAPGEEISMAMEPMVKLPWHARGWLEPYVAAGPVVLRIHDARHRFYLGGGQLVFGAFIWLTALFGIDLDIAMGAARGPDMSLTDLTIAIGPVLRE